MIFEFSTAYNVLKSAADSWNAANTTLDPIETIKTRWQAEKESHALPAFILDVNGPEDGELIENGRELPAGNFFYFEAAVRHEDDPITALGNLEAMIGIAETAFRNGIDAAVVMMQKEISDVPFGKQTSLSFMCTLYVGYFTA